MNKPQKLVLASHNPGKIREFQTLFQGHDIAIIGANELGLPEPDETEDTFEGNALIKARHACEITAMPCLADDSGLSVAALDGAPGVDSALWAGPNRDFTDAMKKIGEAVKNHPDQSATFVAVLTLVYPDGREIIARGEVSGSITYPPRGEHGFGYDPIFIPEGESKTFGQLGAAGKDRYSHRRRAFDCLIEKLGG